MKKQLKLMSLLLSLTLLLISAAPLTANAFDSIDADATAQLITPSANAIYSVYGSAAPAGLCRELAELDVTVTGNTLIEIVPMDSGTGTALTVTNSENATILKDTIFGVDGNGQIASIQPVDENAALPMASHEEWIPGDKTVFKATAIYNIYEDGRGYFCQPQGMYAFYYPNSTDTVSYVWVHYECTGIRYTYPGLVDQGGTTLDNYEADIEEYNPAPNIVYSDTHAYDSGYALFFLEDGFGGQYIEYEIIINGTTKTWVVPILQ